MKSSKRYWFKTICLILALSLITPVFAFAEPPDHSVGELEEIFAEITPFSENLQFTVDSTEVIPPGVMPASSRLLTGRVSATDNPDGVVVTVPHANGGAPTNMINNINKTGSVANTTMNTWGATPGTAANRYFITLSWPEPMVITAASALWWIFTDTGVHWPVNAFIEYSMDEFAGTLVQQTGTGSGQSAQATALAAMSWTRIDSIGVAHNANAPGASWVRNTRWNNIVLAEPIVARHVRLSVQANKTSGTAPGFGVNLFNVYGDIFMPEPAEITTIGPITGAPVAEQVLTAGDIAFIGPTPTVGFGYRWESADAAEGPYTAIAGATRNTYTLTEADVGKFIRVVAFGTLANITGSANSLPVGPVAPPPAPEITSIGPITGVTIAGRELTAGSLTFSRLNPTTGFSYQWQSADAAEGPYTPIAGATGRTYTLAASDVGKFITVAAIGNGTDVTGSAVSLAVGPVLDSVQAMVIFDEQVEGRAPYSTEAEVGDAFGELPVPERNPGFHFLGWFNAPTGGARITATTIVTQQVNNLYAQWQAVPTVGNEHLQRNLELFPDMYDPVTNTVRPIFSNAADRVIQEEVWIESPMDTDFDGQRDLIRVAIRRPIETRTHGLKSPVIAHLSPYSGNIPRAQFEMFFYQVDTDFPAQGYAPTRFHHTRFLGHNPDFDWDGSPLKAWENPPRSYLYDTIYGPEGDLSYQAMRNLVDQRVGVGPNALVSRYRDLIEHGMLDREIDDYTDWHYENFSWLPPARTPTGWQKEGSPVRANVEATTPGTANPTAGAFGGGAAQIPRGIAVVRVDYGGNSHAQGFTQYGMYQESLAAAALVDWLNGRIRGYTDPTGTIQVEAYWATGEVGMSGASYDGTLPFVAAITGVEGLRTIAPGVPVTNAYDYNRGNGLREAPGTWQGECLFSMTMGNAGRAWTFLGSAGPPDTRRPGSVVAPNQAIWDQLWSFTRYIHDEALPTAGYGDYSPWWDERNPLSFGDDMRKDVGVIQFHGLNDDNVEMRHTFLMNEMLKYYEIEVVKGFFHQGGHTIGQNRTGTWFTNAIRDEWLDYYLWGIDNDITNRVPNYFVESNTAVGQWTSYDTWPAATNHQKFYPTGGRVGTIQTTPQENIEALSFRDDILLRLTRPLHDDAYYAGRINAFPQFVRDAGFEREALFYRGQGMVMAAGQYHRWRSWLVGGVDSTTAWTATSAGVFPTGVLNRFPSSPLALAGQYDFTREIPDRLLYTMPVEEDFTISGVVAMTAEVAANKDVGAISAMLVEIAPNNQVRIVARGSVDVRNPNPEGTLSFEVPAFSNLSKGGNWHPNYLFQPTNTVPGEFYSYTWEMDVTEYTFRAGRQLGLIIFSSDPEFIPRPFNPTEFTVNIGSGTYLQLPVIGYGIEDTSILITFDEQVEGRAPYTRNVEEGMAIGELPVPERNPGFHFLGWFTAPEGGTRITEGTIVTELVSNLYGQWQAVPNVGNEHFQRNLELFPNLWNPALYGGRGGVAPIFSNAADRVIMEEVWIEAPIDTDFDGQRDLIRVGIRRQVETRDDGLRVPVKIAMTPYSSGNIRGNTYRIFMNRTDIDIPDQGPARTRFSHTRFLGHNPEFDWDASPLRAWENPPRSYLYNTIYGPEGDLSYRALRDLVDRRVGVGPEAGVARYRELLEHDMMKRQAHEYTDWHFTNFSWLPPARTPTGWQREGTPIWSDNPALGPVGPNRPTPGTFGLDNNFGTVAARMQRGIAHLRVEYLGNRYSQGITSYGQVEESLAAAAVIDWLNGRIRGFADPAGTIEVEAYWATGEAASTGWSYNGTLPLAAAMTGVEGLRTIMPAVAPSMSYAYVRENGTRNAWGIWGNGGCLFSMTMGMHGNLWFMTGATQSDGGTGVNGRPASVFFPTDYAGDDPRSPATFDTFSPASVVDTLWSYTRYMQEHADDLTGDYSPWWAERNALSFGEDMRKDVGVIIVHGLNDYNVTMRHAYLYNEMLKYYGIDVVKGIFTQAGHGPGSNTPNSFFQTSEMMEWLEHYLWGIENGITDRMPNYSIECNTRPWNNAASTWHESETWPLGTHQRFYPSGGRVGTLSPARPTQTESLIFEDEFILGLTRHANSIPGSTWFEDQTNWWPQYIQDMGLRRESFFYQGQGQGSGPQMGRWTSWIVGADDRATAWANNFGGNTLAGTFTSGQQPRFSVSPAAAAAAFDFTREIPDRLLFTMPVEEDMRLSGVVAMTAEVAANRDRGVISAMLVEIAENNAVRIVARSGVDVRNPNPAGTLAQDVPGMSNIEYGGHWAPNYIFQSVDIVPGEFYSYTWELDVTDYTFRAGRQLGLIIYGSDPGFTIRPLTETTEFTVRIGSGTYLQLPVVGYVPAEEPITQLRLALNAITRVPRNATLENIGINVNEGAGSGGVILSVSNPALAEIGADGRSVNTFGRAGTVTLTATCPDSGLRHSVTLMIT